MPKATLAQVRALEITERTTSILSLVGCSFIIITFLSSTAFHKPINRLVFYASLGNVITNIATLISVSGVAAGAAAPLCQMQAFIIQMFMPADSLWTLAMACNVYLTFFRKYDQTQLRNLEWKYVCICYGVPSMPAIVYLFLHTAKSGKVYGPATLWCWISPKWDVLRVATFYGPVWIVILTTFTIYTIAGIDIFQKRRQLRSFYKTSPNAIPPILENPFTSTKTTEVKITSEAMVLPGSPRCMSPAIRMHQSRYSNDRNQAQNYQQYSITIESGNGAAVATQVVPKVNRRNVTTEANRAAWGYTRCAFFFFIALLVTWVPSSVNRVYALAHPTVFNFPLNFTSALVLPLQGFWNSVIYISTSLPACRALWATIVNREGSASRRRNRALSLATVKAVKDRERSSAAHSSVSS